MGTERSVVIDFEERARRVEFSFTSFILK